jgi:hypothetical protein
MSWLPVPARRRLLAAVLAGLLPAMAVAPANATPPTFSIEVLAKAAADECFAGVGVSYPTGPPCETGQPKVNQAYVWSLAKAGHRLWFGTGANVLCLKPPGYTIRGPELNEDYVCEYGDSERARQNPDLPDTLGDFRPPEIYFYDLRTGGLTPKTAEVTASPADAELLNTTAGLRAGAAHRGVVILGGPSMVRGVNMFAFDAVTGDYLGSTHFTTYENLRHFTVAAGTLYAGVGVGINGGEGGRVLRWAGDRSDPFRFVEVGELAQQVADLAEHAGRLFVTTWPETVFEEGLAAAPPAAAADEPPVEDDGLAGVWMSPPLAAGDPGLNPSDALGWTRVWHTGEYEPDQVIARAYALGGLASFRGKLYWGTMHVPLQATFAHIAVYPPRTPAQAQATAKNAHRAAAVFRGNGFSGERSVELLYGAAELPAYNSTTAAWAPTTTNYTPLYGAAGFGDPFNAYAWRMAVAGGRLYIGTMDWAYLTDQTPANPAFGGDLWMFGSGQEPASAVDTAGVGNYLNQGVRNIITDGDTLYLGTANPFNLRTDPNDAVPEGGWELIRVKPHR